MGRPSEIRPTPARSETQAALVKLVHKAKAEVSGIFSLIAVGDDWKKRLEGPKRCPIEVITKIKPKQ